MCGIFGILDIKTDVSELRTQALELSKLLRHRGPDWSGIWHNDNTILCHERLAIVDVDTGAQPLISDNGNQVLAVNGEIYNHKDLESKLATPYNFATKSDCLSSLRPRKQYLFNCTRPHRHYSVIHWL